MEISSLVYQPPHPADEINTHESRRVHDAQPNRPLHRQVRVKRALAPLAHGHCTDGVVDRVSVVAGKRVQLVVGVQVGGRPELAQDVARPGGRGDECARGSDPGAHYSKVDGAPEQVWVDGGGGEGVGGREGDVSAW